MIEGIVNALGHLIETAERNFKGAALTAALALIFGGVYLIGEHLQSLHPTPSQEQQLLDRTVSAGGRIDAALDRTLGAINADRVLVAQYSNGQSDISGLAFMKSTITYASVAPGVALDLAQIGAVPLSFFGPFLTRMRADPKNLVCVHMHVADPEISSTARARFKSRGVEELYTCPMVSETGLHVGAITADYSRRDTPSMSDEQVFARLRDTADFVQANLRGVMANREEAPFWKSFLDFF